MFLDCVFMHYHIEIFHPYGAWTFVSILLRIKCSIFAAQLFMPYMNTAALFQYFVVAGLINTSMFAFLLLTKKKHTVVAVLLIIFMLLASFQALLNAFDTRSFFMTYPHLSRISWVLPTVFGPLIYLFTYYLTSRSPRFRNRDLLHFIPFAVYFILLLPWFVQSADDKRALLDDFEALSVFDFGWMNQFTIPWTLAYLLLSLRQLQRYRRELADTHSEISLYQFQWLRQFIYIVLSILVISALGFYGRKWDIPLLTNIYHYNYAIIVIALYWMAYKSITQPALFNLEGKRLATPAVQGNPVVEPAPITVSADSELLIPVAEVPDTAAGMHERQTAAADLTPVDEVSGEAAPDENRKYAKSGLDAAATEILLARLLTFMEEAQPYLEPELTIYTLATELESNRHHLSQVINAQLGTSFFDFINSYRVKAVQAKLADPALRKLSILGIAYDCGFNSKATFNTSFKKHTGMTPSAYLKSLSQ